MIQWQNIEKYLVNLHSSKKGERSYPSLLMFKALLLQSWYNLSDQQLESKLALDQVNFTLGEREYALGYLLFRRFVGIGYDDSVLDHGSIWRFRQKVSE